MHFGSGYRFVLEHQCSQCAQPRRTHVGTNSDRNHHFDTAGRLGRLGYQTTSRSPAFARRLDSHFRDIPGRLRRIHLRNDIDLPGNLNSLDKEPALSIRGSLGFPEHNLESDFHRIESCPSHMRMHMAYRWRLDSARPHTFGPRDTALLYAILRDHFRWHLHTLRYRSFDRI